MTLRSTLGLLFLIVLTACAPARTLNPALTSAAFQITQTFPAGTATVAAPSAPVEKRDVTFTTPDGLTLNGTLYGQGKVAVIFSNMGDKRQGSWAEMAQVIAEQGYLALTYDFRYWVNNRIDERLLERVADDLSAAVTFVRDHGAEKVVLVGASLGGMATAKSAASSAASAVIIIASPMRAPGLDLQVEVAELQAILAPKLFISSERDNTVDTAALQQMYDLAVDPKELYIYPNTTAHGSDLFAGEHGADLTQRLIDFVISHAPPESAPETP